MIHICPCPWGDFVIVKVPVQTEICVRKATSKKKESDKNKVALRQAPVERWDESTQAIIPQRIKQYNCLHCKSMSTWEGRNDREEGEGGDLGTSNCHTDCAGNTPEERLDLRGA